MTRIFRAILVFLSLATPLAAPPGAAAAEDLFAWPPGLEPDVEFWLRIYSEVDTHGGLIHDSRHLDIVYHVIDLPDRSSARTLERAAEKARKSVTAALRSLARGKRSNLSAMERQVLAQWPTTVSNTTLRQAAGRVRFQLGQADKFREGLIRSGRWEPHIRATLSRMGLPAELSALPHVESSYNPAAYSRVGAAGLWQFTRSTGRRFMRVDHVVDERLDPYRATVAAAQLLDQNRKVTGSWPLAITAYNHGASGMRRAARKLGTRDIAKIVRHYKSRTFGFASRNFYVEFLAALEVDLHSEKYFGRLPLDLPREYHSARVPFYVSANSLQRHLGVSLSGLQRANPALRPTVWQGAKYVPKDFTLRVERDDLSGPLEAALAKLPREQRHATQTRDRSYTVRRGDTLSRIASRHHVSERELAQINGLRNRHRIRIGQKLRLPSDRQTRVAATRREPLGIPADGLYAVRRGDTLSRIAARHGLVLNDVISLNQLDDMQRIHVGQPIRLVASAPRVDSPASEPTSNAAAVQPAVERTVEAPAIRDAVSSLSTATATADVRPEAATPSPQADFGPKLGPLEASEPRIPSEPEYSPALPADPSDYSVTAKRTIEVQAEETLGHYAEWLGIRASLLRSINGMSYGDPLVIGGRLKLDFRKATPEEFEARRIEHHRRLQDAFFDRFEIAGITIHVARRGESLWLLSQKKYRVPLWLLRQHNPDLSLQELRAGTQITIPKLRAHNPIESGDRATTAGLRTG